MPVKSKMAFYKHDPFGLVRFATGTHSQRPLCDLCSFVLGRAALYYAL